jgi:hypothetical protein
MAAAMTMTLGVVAQPASAHGPMTYEGRQLSVAEVIGHVYDAGFTSEQQLVTVTSIAIAESSLYTRLRHFHPELGYRPAGDQLAVRGPDWARSDSWAQAHADRGIFQINTRWWGHFSDTQTDDPASAARLVMDISQGGRDFSPWDTYNNGSAQAHFDSEYNGWPAVRPLVRQFLAGRRSTLTAAAARTGTAHSLAYRESLFEVAQRYYGDGDRWRDIAAHNSIPVPDQVLTGQVIRLP